MRESSELPLPRLYAALLRARHLTPAALAVAAGLPPGEGDAHLEALAGLGFAQPSRDVAGAWRAVHPVFAIGRVVLDMLEGARPVGALAAFGGLPAASRLVATYRLAFPATYLPTSLDTFASLLEEALTQATREVRTLHTTPVPDSRAFLENCVDYLHRRGVALRVVMAEQHHADPGWGDLRDTLAARGIPVLLHPALACRGVVVDGGALVLAHTDTAGVLPDGAGVPCLAPAPTSVPGPIRPLVVLRHLGAGATTTATAHAVDASARTIERDMTLLQHALEAEGRADLVRRAALLGLV